MLPEPAAETRKAAKSTFNARKPNLPRTEPLFPEPEPVNAVGTGATKGPLRLQGLALPPSDGFPGAQAYLSAPPEVALPIPRRGFSLPDSRAYRGFYPTRDEAAKAEEAAADLRRINLTKLFGSLAPSGPELATAVENAVLWLRARDAAAQWDEFVRAHYGMAWRHALTELERLRGPFQLAAERDPSLATKFAGLAEMLAAPKAIAKQSSATRRANKKAREVKTLVDAKATAAPAASTAKAGSVAPATPRPTMVINT
jgi:hypothetical protein